MGLTAVQIFRCSEQEGKYTESTTQLSSVMHYKTQLHCQEFILMHQHQTAHNQLNNEPFSKQLEQSFTRIGGVKGQDRVDWGQVFSKDPLRCLVTQFLNPRDLCVLKKCNCALRYYAVSIVLQRSSNWNLTLDMLNCSIMKQSKGGYSMSQQESQHSEDLDRTSGYFQTYNQVELYNYKLRLDRIITAVQQQVQYFQGIMPIAAVLLQQFDDSTSFCLLRYLLFKSNYVQNNSNLYSQFMHQLLQEFTYYLPTLQTHILNQGLELGYFVMKWILGLFAQDLPKPLLLSIWDSLLQTDIYFLIYVVIQIFQSFKTELIQTNADGINELLKCNIKMRLELISKQQFMDRSKSRYIERRLHL